MFKHSKGKFGKLLGKTTGWNHRATLKKKKVHFVGEVNYTKTDDIGLNHTQGEENKVLAVDTIGVCAGQQPFKDLYQPLIDQGKLVHVIGGADVASELDAKRAINQGARLAASL